MPDVFGDSGAPLMAPSTSHGSGGEPLALSMVGIEKYFGVVCALRNINLEVGRNEIVGLIGDNGAGKSTLVKILTGVFPPPGVSSLLQAEKSTGGATLFSAPTPTASKPSTRTSHWAKSRPCGAISSLGEKSPSRSDSST